MRPHALFLAIVSLALLVSSVAPGKGKGKKTRPGSKPKPTGSTGKEPAAGGGNWEDVWKRYIKLKDILYKKEASLQTKLSFAHNVKPPEGTSLLTSYNVDISRKCCYIIRGSLTKMSILSTTFVLSNAFASECSKKPEGSCAYLVYEDLEKNEASRPKTYCKDDIVNPTCCSQKNGAFCRESIHNIITGEGECPRVCKEFQDCSKNGSDEWCQCSLFQEENRTFQSAQKGQELQKTPQSDMCIPKPLQLFKPIAGRPGASYLCPFVFHRPCEFGVNNQHECPCSDIWCRLWRGYRRTKRPQVTSRSRGNHPSRWSKGCCFATQGPCLRNGITFNCLPKCGTLTI